MFYPRMIMLAAAVFHTVFTSEVLAQACHTPYEANRDGITICNLGVLDGGSSSFAKAVSDDGSVIVGNSDSADGERAFLWTTSTGMISLGTLPGGTRSLATDVSADGRVIVGKSNSFGGWHSFIWTEETGMQRIETSEVSDGFSASAISGDGRVVAGYLGSPIGGQNAALWTRETGIRQLDPNAAFSGSTALDINHDGTVIVGRAPFQAFLYSQPEGMILLKSSNDNEVSMAHAVSADGSVIAGFFNGNRNSRSAQWSRDGLAEPVVRDFDNAKNRALGISSDGNVIVGGVQIGDYDSAYAQHQSGPAIVLGGLEEAGSGFVSSNASGANMDGSIVVGSSTGEDGHRAVSWLVNYDNE